MKPARNSPAVDRGSDPLDYDYYGGVIDVRSTKLRKLLEEDGVTSTDQRGFDRPVGAPTWLVEDYPVIYTSESEVVNLADGSDMGAVELQDNERAAGGGGGDSTGTSTSTPGGGGGGGKTTQNPPAPQHEGGNPGSDVLAALVTKLRNGVLQGRHLAFTDVFPTDGTAIYGLDLTFDTAGASAAKVNRIHVASKRVSGKAGAVHVGFRLSRKALRTISRHPGAKLVVRTRFVNKAGHAVTSKRSLNVKRPKLRRPR
jgi:hypothetical protein